MTAPSAGAVPSARSVTRAGREQPAGHTLSAGLDRVREALVAEWGVTPACADAGRRLADDGVPLDDALEALRELAVATTGRDPAYDAVAAFAGGWSDATLAYLHQLSCEDPLSGLATLAHLRTRLGELYRVDPEAVARGHALVVLELVRRSETSLDTALRVARVAGLARTVWPGEETVTRAARSRILVLTRRDDGRAPRLGRRTALLRTMAGADLARTWVEALPRTDAAAAGLLDELARG